MINKKILGIYASRDSLHYISISRGLSGYSLKSPAHGLGSHGNKIGNGHALLRSFLSDLEVDKSRSIYLALPRYEFFIRDISLPAMPAEDAILSIKNSLSIYSHLPADSIYYDLIISGENTGSFNSLLVYAPKDEMEKYRRIFEETGHGYSLKAIFPLSYGICALPDDDMEHSGDLLSQVQDDTYELFVRSKKSMIYSISCQNESSDEKRMLLNAVIEKFPDLGESASSLADNEGFPISGKPPAEASERNPADRAANQSENQSDDQSEDQSERLPDLLKEQMPLEEGSPKQIISKKRAVRFGSSRKLTETRKTEARKKKCPFLPSLSENSASAAVAPVISGIQQISIDDQPVKLNIIHPFRYIIPFLCLLIGVLFYISLSISSENDEAQAQLDGITKEVKLLERDFDPLQKKIDTLKKASKFKMDVKEFIQSKPKLYTILNEIAELIPDGTWFANCTFNNNGITLRGTGSDALKTVELLRSSPLFENVMLRGSVNRRPNGDESFTITFSLKNGDINPEDTNPEEGDTVKKPAAATLIPPPPPPPPVDRPNAKRMKGNFISGEKK